MGSLGSLDIVRSTFNSSSSVMHRNVHHVVDDSRGRCWDGHMNGDRDVLDVRDGVVMWPENATNNVAARQISIRDSPRDRDGIQPEKLTWNLKIIPVERRFIFQTFNSWFPAVSFQGLLVLHDSTCYVPCSFQIASSFHAFFGGVGYIPHPPFPPCGCVTWSPQQNQVFQSSRFELLQLWVSTSFFLRLFQHTELEHTPNRNLCQQAINRDSFHNWRTGDCLGCAPGVCCSFLGFLV